MTKSFNEAADKYFETFKDFYPMGMIEESEEEAIARMNECLEKNKSAPQIWPELFGSCKGRDI